jgi:hypothetical protein
LRHEIALLNFAMDDLVHENYFHRHFARAIECYPTPNGVLIVSL